MEDYEEEDEGVVEEDYAEDDVEEDGEEYDDEDGEEEGEEEMPPSSKPPLKTMKLTTTTTTTPKPDDSPMDLLFLKCLTDQQLSRDMQEHLLSLVSPPDARKHIPQAIADIRQARALTDVSAAFDRYYQGLESFRKACTLMPRELQPERTIKFVVYNICKLSKKLDDRKLWEMLLARMRDFLIKSDAEAIRAVGLCLCLRIGSTAITNLKLFFEKKEAKKLQSTKVIMQYYKGRLATIEGRTQDAIAHFIESYRGITNIANDPKAFANKKRVFERLIPLRLVTGRYPKRALMQQFNLDWRYEKLIDYAKAGDLGRLLVEFERHENYFSKLECAAMLRVWLTSVANQHILRIAFRELGKDVLDLRLLASLSIWSKGNASIKTEDDSMDHICYVIADLISRGMLVGEIVYEQNSLVLKGPNPFPSLKVSVPKPFKASDW